MKECNICGKNQPLENYYKDTYFNKPWSKCKSCVSLTRAKTPIMEPKPKSYKDYLKEQGMLEYYKRSRKYASYL